MNKQLLGLFLTAFVLTCGTVMAKDYTFCYDGYAFKTTLCGVDSVRYAAGQTVTLSAGMPTKEGDVFLGWSYNGVTYQPGAQFTMPAANVALKALWLNTPSGLTETQAARKAEKVMINGILHVRVGEHIYNAQGEKIK